METLAELALEIYIYIYINDKHPLTLCEKMTN